MKYIPKKTFTWILLLFVLYAYIEHYNNKPTVKEEEIAQIVVKPTNDKIDTKNKALNYIINKLSKTDSGQTVVDALVAKSLKSEHKNKDIYLVRAESNKKVIKLDQRVGDGDLAQCGSNVKLNYDLFTENSVKIDSTVEPITFNIGQNKYIKGLENGIIGMRKGGKRKVAVPPHLAYDDLNFTNDLIDFGHPIILLVELLDVNNGISTSPVFHSHTIKKGKEGTYSLCGDKITISIKNNLDQIKQFMITLGDETIPLGISEAFLNMNIGEKRNVLLQNSNSIKKTTHALKEIFNVGKNNNINLEVELLSINR